MKKSLFAYMLIPFTMLYFSGCAKYYSTSSVETERISIEKEIPVKVKITKSDWSIVVNLSDEKIRQDVLEVIKNNPVFVENNSSSEVLHVDIKHSNEDGSSEMTGAFFTGLTLYLIPSVADSVVDITVSMNNVTSRYTGELVVAQGLGSRAFIDDGKYTTDKPQNLMKNLIKNALDQFTVEYMKQK